MGSSLNDASAPETDWITSPARIICVGTEGDDDEANGLVRSRTYILIHGLCIIFRDSRRAESVPHPRRSGYSGDSNGTIESAGPTYDTRVFGLVTKPITIVGIYGRDKTRILSNGDYFLYLTDTTEFQPVPVVLVGLNITGNIWNTGELKCTL